MVLDMEVTEDKEEREDEKKTDSQESEDSSTDEEAPLEDDSAEPKSENEVSEEIEEEEIDLEAEVAELKDKLLRAMAESENVRRRAERDKENSAKYSIANFAREMLRVNDNLRRALESVDEKSREENEALKNLVVGVEMTEREMLNAFERAGVKPIKAMGQKFDPNLHEAMFEVEDKDQPAGTVVQELETGYVIHDRALRPARVGVSKGGPKAPLEEGSNDKKPSDSMSKGQSVYEKQAEAQSDASGSQVDEEL